MTKDDEAFGRDRDDLEKVLNENPRRVPRWAIIAGAAAVALVIGVGIAIGFGRGEVSAAPTDSPSGSASPSAGDAEPSASPTGASSPSPSTGTAEPEPSETAEPGSPDARETLPPADLDSPVRVDEGPTVAVSSIESVMGEAVLPGEVSGPAVRVTVVVRNRTDEPIDLTTAVVTLYQGESGLQASPVSKPAGQAFPSEVAPGKRAKGVFVFELPEDQRTDVRIEVDLSVSDPLIAFEGDIE
ncbi:DUF4352 domain-containing protein [Microbacterium terricola]|nr:DUF4352 domain-containing protein [Microbacterium terricola]UYK39734.1 DUF4352 domain-containing protein [Microbacterium terricola]